MKTWLWTALLQIACCSCYPSWTNVVDVDVDVAIIGGGSGGINAAIQLKDVGAKVLVIEKKSQIGGHAETYVNPTTKLPANNGVVIFQNQPIVADYFARLHVPTLTVNPDAHAASYDFKLGIPIPPLNSTQADQANQALAAAIQSYTANVLTKYSWIDQGYFVPNPVPDELTIPFGEFAAKYNFSPLVPLIAQLNWFAGNISTVPALYGIKSLGPGLLGSVGRFLATASGDTRTLYDAASAELGESIMLSTSILQVRRNYNFTDSNGKPQSGIGLTVQQGGRTVLVRAKKLVVAIPPVIDNIGSFDLSPNELSLFSKITSIQLFAGVGNIPGFNNSVQNVGATTPFNQPAIPGDNGFFTTGSPGDFLFKVGAETPPLSQSGAIDVVKGELSRLAAVGGVPPNSAQTLTVPFISDHSPYNCRVPASDIQAGFYAQFLGLQGQRNTYWTGAAWAGHDSSLIWTWNNVTVVSGLKKDLGI